MTSSGLLAHHCIEAPRPAAGESKIQKCKTKADREVAFTENWKEAARKMFDEIGRGHFAGQDKATGRVNRPRNRSVPPTSSNMPAMPNRESQLKISKDSTDRPPNRLAVP